MPEEVVYYVTGYGYLAVFIMVFLQEIGMPNLFPNELLLIFSGYLSFSGHLFLPLVILTAVSADFLGTNILYYTFYYAGNFIMLKKPRWFPISAGMIEKLTKKINNGGLANIFVFRCTPFTRGYVSVITGLLRVRAKVYMPITLYSAIAWASFYVITGYMIGPSWNLFSQNLDKFKYVLLSIFIITLVMILFIKYIARRKKARVNKSFDLS